MTTAQELISIIERRGGRLTVEGDKLVIEPPEAGLPVVDSLRSHKLEIIALIQSRPVDNDALSLWLLERCRFDLRCASGTSALYLDFASWCVSRGWRAPTSRQVFAKALDGEGFTLTPAGFWLGLILREDLDTILEGA
jgi:hypothetical protein